MKTRILTLVLVLGVFIFTSCDSDDDTAPMDPIHGIWNLVNVSGGFAGINEDYESGSITWSFNSQDLTITVQNNTGQINLFSGYVTGTYPYAIIEANENVYLVINNTEFGSYIVSDTSLNINQNEFSFGTGADGFFLQFER